MKALLIVDVQNDFCPGGALGVEGGDEVVPIINDLATEFDLVIASRDWHPEDTVHFEKWPVHCVKGTQGAEFHPDLKLDNIHQFLVKGTENKDDGYSAFEATNLNLAEFLREKDVDTLYIAGLTTDYCVKYSAIDAAKNGFDTRVIIDATRAVEASPGDKNQAMDQMKKAGCKLVLAEQVARGQ
jgi:nicotinamidase/pyrazinamidase